MWLTLLWFLATSMACRTSGGSDMLLYLDFPFSCSCFSLYSFCWGVFVLGFRWNIKNLKIKTNHTKHDLLWNYGALWWWQYPALHFGHLLAVNSITCRGQGGEWPSLVVLLAGFLVFTLKDKICRITCTVLAPITFRPYNLWEANECII